MGNNDPFPGGIIYGLTTHKTHPEPKEFQWKLIPL